MEVFFYEKGGRARKEKTFSLLLPKRSFFFLFSFLIKIIIIINNHYHYHYHYQLFLHRLAWLCNH